MPEESSPRPRPRRVFASSRPRRCAQPLARRARSPCASHPGGCTELAAWRGSPRAGPRGAVLGWATARLLKPVWALLGTRLPRPAWRMRCCSWPCSERRQASGRASFASAALIAVALPALADLCASCAADSITVERRSTAYAWLDMAQGSEAPSVSPWALPSRSGGSRRRARAAGGTVGLPELPQPRHAALHLDGRCVPARAPVSVGFPARGPCFLRRLPRDAAVGQATSWLGALLLRSPGWRSSARLERGCPTPSSCRGWRSVWRRSSVSCPPAAAGDGHAVRGHPRFSRPRRGRDGSAAGVLAGLVCPGPGSGRGRRVMNERSFSREERMFSMTRPHARHQLFRRTLREYAEKELAPHALEWDEAGIFPREVFAGLAEIGALGINYPESVGGRAATTGTWWCWRGADPQPQLGSQHGRAGPVADGHAHHPGDRHRRAEEGVSRSRLAGEKIAALGISERTPQRRGEPQDHRPAGGRRVRDQRRQDVDHERQQGGLHHPGGAHRRPGYGGISLVTFPTDVKGYGVSKKLAKIGNLSSDTALLFFEDCRIPTRFLLGRRTKVSTTS